MEVVMEAMRMAGLALGLQAFSSVALGESRPMYKHKRQHGLHTLGYTMERLSERYLYE